MGGGNLTHSAIVVTHVQAGILDLHMNISYLVQEMLYLNFHMNNDNYL